jgi:ABC-2 type transport system ATP-binding protein
MDALSVEIKNLTKTYGQFKAVDGLNLAVPANSVFGLLGPNGAGKSTTLRMLLALITPTGGEIKFFGKSLAENRMQCLAQIGCIIEKPDFYLYLSARNNLKLLAQTSRVPFLKKRADELFELVGLQGRENEVVKNYSHGMKQRLGIAQALLHDPKLIILDEPTTGLDPQGIIDLRYLILKLKNELGKTVILSSHILSEIELVADSMAIINKGRAVVQGKVAELLTEKDLLVSVEFENSTEAKSKITASQWKDSLRKQEGSFLYFNLMKTQIPGLLQFLNENNLRIFALNTRRSLEEFYLQLTHN